MERTIEKIKILPETINKNGFTYFLVQRTPNKAIYKQTHDNVQVGFEVFRIRIQLPRFSLLLKKSFGASERFPANSDFGRTAWSIQKHEDAIKKFNDL